MTAVPGVRLSFIPPQFIKVATAYRWDLTQFVIGGVHLPPGASNGSVRIWRVDLPTLTNGGEIPFVNAAGKDDSVDLEILRSGELLITISEALPGGSGATAAPTVYRIPGIFPPLAASGGDDGYTTAPGGAIRVFAPPAPFEGQVTIALTPLGVPLTSALNVRLCISADAANRRGRAGPTTASSGMGMLTVETQAPGSRIYAASAIGAGPGNTLIVQADNGPLAELFVDVQGWW